MKRSATLLALLTAVPACGTAGSTRTSPPADGGPGDGGSGPFATLSLVAGQPGGLGNVDETGTAARFALPWYVADDVRGHLYVSDGQAIRRVDEGSGAVTTLAGIAYSVSQAGGFVDGVGQAARFDSPSGVACDSGGTVYVADTGNSAVRAIEASTGAVTTIVRAADVDVGPSGAKHFTPVGLAFDGQSSVYVADFGYVASGGQPAGETGGAIYRIALPGAISARRRVAGERAARPRRHRDGRTLRAPSRDRVRRTRHALRRRRLRYPPRRRRERHGDDTLGKRVHPAALRPGLRRRRDAVRGGRSLRDRRHRDGDGHHHDGRRRARWNSLRIAFAGGDRGRQRGRR